MPEKTIKKKKGTHLLTRTIIFMAIIAVVPLIIAALSIRIFDNLQKKDIDARQIDVILRVEHDLNKEFSTKPNTNGTIIDSSGNQDKKTIIGLPDESTAKLKETLKSVITENEIKRTGYIFITDDRGMLLVHSQKEVSEPVDLSSSPIVGSQLFQGNIKLEGQPSYDSYWGVPVIGNGKMTTIVGFDKKIGVFVELPAKESNTDFVFLATQFSIVAVFAFLLTAIFGYYLASGIISPIRELQRGTKRIVEEKFDEPVKIKSANEIEDLGEAFNTMMGGLKELKELREEFIFVAAHELRTPVTAIKGFIQLVLEEQAATANTGVANPSTTLRTREYLTKAIGANERLITLVNDLLEVAREEAGRLEIEVRPTNITEPIATTISELSQLAKEKQIEIKYSPSQFLSDKSSEGKPAKDLPQVQGDARRIGEVTTNLIGNSIKYMGGAGTITVSHEIKGDKLVTYIADTGTGISKEAQGKLFEKFYRVYNEKTKDVKGTGLGLFIVKKIIEKMGGKITVESPTLPSGGGTTFSFELPVAK
ncbi:MAG: HAMP domain-containing sensor histidine kinase [bacterium]|nr:HAMP domain-containing sensor histidine kinase [bacterium]